MRLDVRVVFAVVALSLSACQGSGLDSGMPGMMGPPVQQPGPMGSSGNTMGSGMSGPQVNSNGQVELTMPGATLAPNEVQFTVGSAPNGVKCPSMARQQIQFQQFSCTLAFNIPAPTPTPAPGTTAKPAPTATPTPTPAATSSADSDDSDDSDSDSSPSPTPPGTVTMLVQPLPTNVPTMTNPDPRAMHITPAVALRLQSDTNFELNGYATVSYTMPQQLVIGRTFAIQLYSEASLRGQRTDQYLATYTKSTMTNNTVQFSFPMPKVTVPRGQVWLMALYGMNFPSGTTPSPSPSPSSGASPSASGSPSPTPSASP